MTYNNSITNNQIGDTKMAQTYHRAKISRKGKSKNVMAESISILDSYCERNGWTSWTIIQTTKVFEIVK